MNAMIATLTLSLCCQVTPKELARHQERQKQNRIDQSGNHLGTKRTRWDPAPGRHWPAGIAPNVASRCRWYDMQFSDSYANSIGWPHRIDGKVFDDLDDADRQKLVDQQARWISRNGSNPALPHSLQLHPWQVSGFMARHPEIYHGVPHTLPPSELRGFAGGAVYHPQNDVNRKSFIERQRIIKELNKPQDRPTRQQMIEIK